MRIPTVVLQNKQTGKRVVVNESEWAQDLGRGRWRNYKRVGEMHSGRVEDKLILTDNMDDADKALHAAVVQSTPPSIDNEQPAAVDTVDKDLDTVDKDLPSGQSAQSVDEDKLQSLEKKAPRRRRRRAAKEE